jgi:uncharacterized spore protein YtfJ
MEQVQEILEVVGGGLGEVASGEAVVGSPIQLGQVTVYPISRLSLGLGGGGGQGENEAKGDRKDRGTETGVGGGGGGGAKARPVAVLVASPEGVSVLAIPDRKGKLDAILDKIPGFIERLESRKKPTT